VGVLVLTVFMLAMVEGSSPESADARAPTRLIAIGGYGMCGPTQMQFGAAVRSFASTRNTAMLLTLGDNDYSRNTAFDANWQESFGWVDRVGIPISGALGNHDIEASDGSQVFERLNMPGPYYTRTVGSIDVFVLNSNDVSGAQTRWLGRALRRSDARWKVATMHHPAHTCGGHRSSDAVREHWVPLFEKFGVQLVLAGHDHNYQRFRARNRVNYLVHGGGGRPAHPLRACDLGEPKLVQARAVVGLLSIVARKKALVVKAINLRGRQIDRVAIRP
jgi:hypothetical protein